MLCYSSHFSVRPVCSSDVESLAELVTEVSGNVDLLQDAHRYLEAKRDPLDEGSTPLFVLVAECAHQLVGVCVLREEEVMQFITCYLSLSACMCMSVCMHVYACLHACVCLSAHTCMSVCMHIYVCLHTFHRTSDISRLTSTLTILCTTTIILHPATPTCTILYSILSSIRTQNSSSR